MDFRKRQLKRALEPLRQALESHQRSLEGLERALIEFEDNLNEPEQRPERAQAQQQGAGGGLDLLSITDVCQEFGADRASIYRMIMSGEIPHLKLGRTLKVRREDLKEYTKSRQHHLELLGEENSVKQR